MGGQANIEAKAQVPAIVVGILARRGIAGAEVERFLYPNYDKDLHDPFLMTDMEAAVRRVLLARERGEQVVVYGDYDIDGITASAVLLEVFKALGLAAQSYIPDRFEEGYGLNEAALAKLHAEGAQLIVSVDCGITSVGEAEWARAHGLDLIITDHHSVPEVLPEAVAVVNPKRMGDRYPFKELAGVGVAFKLAQALQARTGVPAVGQEKWLLDLVGLGTICDVVPLVGENRVLASFGLKVLRSTRRPGLLALADSSGIRLDEASAYHAGYMLGPRMNAAGRLDHAARSLELVMTPSPARGQEIAAQLEELNRARRAQQQAIFVEADKRAQAMTEDRVLVMADPGWSHGVAGIVASKLAEKWGKPVLIAQELGDKVKGSARSVGNFNMVGALRANAELLERFGGHFYAAGYTLSKDKLELLRLKLNEGQIEASTEVAEAPPNDIELRDLHDISWEMLGELELLEPHGNSNPRPQIGIDGLEIGRIKRMGKESEHLRLELVDKTGKRITCVGFGKAERYGALKQGQTVGVCGVLDKNEYQGSNMLQLVISGLRL
jgi:single-stranded-DNA-specific exonuclease